MAAKDHDAAVESLKKALAIKPDLVEAQRGSSSAYLDARPRRPRRWRWRATCRSSGRRNRSASSSKATSTSSKKAWTEAAAAYRNGLKQRRARPISRSGSHAALRAGGKRRRGRQARRATGSRTIRRIATSAPIWRRWRSARRTIAAAVAQYKAMLEIEPDDALALNNLAWVVRPAQGPEGARVCREGRQARARQSRDPRHARHAAGRQGRHQARRRDAAEGGRARARRTGIRLNLARALVKDGQKDAAKKELETLAKLGDKFAGAGRSREADAGALSVQDGATRAARRGHGEPGGDHVADRRKARTMTTVAVVGLGYVGLPLAVEFGKKHRTIGFDLSAEKIASYRRHVDPTGEVSTEELRAATLLSVGSDPAALAEADFIIVAVPTPVDEAHQPDFRPLLGASQSVGTQHEARRDRRLRIDRLSRRHRGDLHPGAGAAFGDEVARGFQRRLFAGAHQPGRQGAHADQDHQGRLGRHAGDARARRADVRQRGDGGRAPRVVASRWPRRRR